MSRPAAVSTLNNPPQLPSKSAWARGPRQNSTTSTSSSSQSSASPTPVSITDPTDFHATDSRRLSALGQGASINDGFNTSQSAVKQGSAVTFGSMDDALTPISSLPASAPTMNSADGVNSFGSIAAQNGVSNTVKPAVTDRPPLSSVPSTSAPSFVPKFDKESIAKLFLRPSTESVPTSTMWPGYYHHPQLVSGVPPDPPVTSSSSTPSEVKPPTSPTLSASAGTFIPRKKITIKSPSGQEVNLDALKRSPPQVVPIAPALTPPPASIKKKKKGKQIRIESQEQKEKRLAEGKAGQDKGEGENKMNETFVKTNDDAARRQIEEHNLKEEAEHAEKERKAAEEWAIREETERQEAEERAVWEAREAEDRAMWDASQAEGAAWEAREAEDRVMWDPREPAERAMWEAREPEDAAWEARETEERTVREAREAEERAVWDAREAEEREKGRLHLVECSQREAKEKIQRKQERFRKFRGEEETFRAEEDGADGELPTNTVEDSESLSRTASVSPPVPIPTGLPAKLSEKPFHINTFLPSPELSRNRPGWRSPQTAAPTSNSAPALPSALATVLATAQHIEDINRIAYPEGIKRPKVELNVNAQKGKFRYDRDFLLQFMNICKESPDNLPLLNLIGKRPGPHNFQITTTRNGIPVLHSTLAPTEHIDYISYSGGIKNPRDEFNANTRESQFSSAPSAVTNESPPPNPDVKPPPRDRPGARSASFLGVGSGESETPDGSRQLSDDSFLQHGKYFFKDGNVTFLIDNILYCVHRYLFSHESLYFSTRFAELGARDHEALSVIVPLRDVKCEDFEAFLSVLYPHFEEHDLSYEQWRSVLHLSTLWGFASRRKLALESIQPPTPYDWLLLARKYVVDHWVVPALHALCERTAPLSLDEARGMNIEDVVLVATIREQIFRFGVSAAEIPRRVEAMQARVSVHAARFDDHSEARGYDGTKSVLTEPMNSKTVMSSGNSMGATTKSQGEHIESSDGEQHWQTTKVVSNDEWDTLPFEGENGKTGADEEQYHQATNAVPTDGWDLPLSKGKKVKAKRLQVQHWQAAIGASSNEWDTPSF